MKLLLIVAFVLFIVQSTGKPVANGLSPENIRPLTNKELTQVSAIPEIVISPEKNSTHTIPRLEQKDYVEYENKRVAALREPVHDIPIKNVGLIEADEKSYAVVWIIVLSVLTTVAIVIGSYFAASRYLKKSGNLNIQH